MAYASWSVVNNEQPSVAKWNILGTNDASFNDGTGIADAAITPAKRSGGFYVGTMVVSASGNQSVTGVGFTPKLVEFHGVLDGGNQSTSNFGFGQGFMDSSGRQWSHWGNVTESGDASGAGNWTTACFATGDPNADVDVAFAYVSMDADGFTVNVSSAENATRIGYVAYG